MLNLMYGKIKNNTQILIITVVGNYCSGLWVFFIKKKIKKKIIDFHLIVIQYPNYSRLQCWLALSQTTHGIANRKLHQPTEEIIAYTVSEDLKKIFIEIMIQGLQISLKQPNN